MNVDSHVGLIARLVLHVSDPTFVDRDVDVGSNVHVAVERVDAAVDVSVDDRSSGRRR